MKIQELFIDEMVMVSAVPLAIDSYGFTYLNDIGLWNITINTKHASRKQRNITNKELIQLFKDHSSCYPNQLEVFEKRKQIMINSLERYDENEIFTY